MLSVQALVAVNFFLCIVLLLSVVLGADFERRGSPHDVLKLRSTGYNNDKPSAAFSRRAGGFFSTTATPLIAANQTQSRYVFLKRCRPWKLRELPILLPTTMLPHCHLRHTKISTQCSSQELEYVQSRKDHRL